MSERYLILVTNFDTGFFLLKSLEHFESISPRRFSRFCFQLDLMFIAVWSDQKFKARPVFRAQKIVIYGHLNVRVRRACLRCIICLFNLDFPAFLCKFQILFFAFSLGLATCDRFAIVIELFWSHKSAHGSMDR